MTSPGQTLAVISPQSVTPGRVQHSTPVTVTPLAGPSGQPVVPTQAQLSIPFNGAPPALPYPQSTTSNPGQLSIASNGAPPVVPIGLSVAPTQAQLATAMHTAPQVQSTVPNQIQLPTTVNVAPTVVTHTQSLAPNQTRLSTAVYAAPPSVSNPHTSAPTAVTQQAPVTAVNSGTSLQNSKKSKSFFSWSWLPWAEPPDEDGRFSKFEGEKSLRSHYPRGYPSVAAFVSGDIDSRVYRGFSYLRNRLLLHRQDEIVVLENSLKALDIADSQAGRERKKRLGSRRVDEKDWYDCPRKGLFDDIEKAMKVYDDLLLREHQIMSIQKASERQHKSLVNFVWNAKKDPTDDKAYKQLRAEEYEFLNRKDDFVLLGSQDDAWLGSSVEAMRYLLPKWLQNLIFATREDRVTSKDTNIRDWSNKRVGTFVKAVVCATTTLLMVLPIAILYLMSVHGASGGSRIGVLCAFVILFAFAVSILTNAKRSDMFGASAAYCAVLIVFLTYSAP